LLNWRDTGLRLLPTFRHHILTAFVRVKLLAANKKRIEKLMLVL